MTLFKFKNKIIGYITQDENGYSFKTGKPSDVSCISWRYDLEANAYHTAHEYIRNYLSANGGSYVMYIPETKERHIYKVY